MRLLLSLSFFLLVLPNAAAHAPCIDVAVAGDARGCTAVAVIGSAEGDSAIVGIGSADGQRLGIAVIGEAHGLFTVIVCGSNGNDHGVEVLPCEPAEG